MRLAERLQECTRQDVSSGCARVSLRRCIHSAMHAFLTSRHSLRNDLSCRQRAIYVRGRCCSEIALARCVFDMISPLIAQLLGAVRNIGRTSGGSAGTPAARNLVERTERTKWASSQVGSPLELVSYRTRSDRLSKRVLWARVHVCGEKSPESSAAQVGLGTKVWSWQGPCTWSGESAHSSEAVVTSYVPIGAGRNLLFVLFDDLPGPGAARWRLHIFAIASGLLECLWR